jgi:phosphopantetheinyl transferase (holo-ACP synthase)
MNAKKQVKSKKRVADHGEVFTNEREVNAMLDLVKHETERIDSRFLEPACGNGNFLAEVLKRKLSIVDNRYGKSQVKWERNCLIAVSSIYGVDVLEDNTVECQERLFSIVWSFYNQKFSAKEEFLKSIKFILKRNILWGDALDFTNPETKKPIVFSEWNMINETMIKRREYIFRFLVEKTHQFALRFNDEGNAAAIDEPVKDFPLIHFLKLG